MARFYVTAQGNRGEASRMGTPASGIASHTRGWDVGVRVEGHANGDGDEFMVWATSGSRGARSSVFLGTVKRDENGETVFERGGQ